MAFDWKTLVGGIAPTLGTMLGGPLAGMAIKVLADKVLGNPDASEADMAKAFEGGQLSGEQIVALRVAEQSVVIRMRELEIDVLKINEGAEQARLLDVQDARSRDVKIQQGGKNTRADIMLALTYAGIVGLVGLMVLKDIDANTALGGAVLLLIGKLIGQWETGFQFEFGSTRMSKAKDATIENLSK